MQNETQTLQDGPQAKSFESRGLRLNYVDWGNPDAPPLVLVHGHKDHCRSWDWVARALKQSWHVMAIDLRGHGNSQWSAEANYSLDAYLYDLAEFMDQLFEQPVAFVSHSLGAAIALRYAAVWPERVRLLVAIEGNNFVIPGKQMKGLPPLEEWIRKSVGNLRALNGKEHRRYASLDDAIQRMRQDHPSLRQDVIDHLAHYGSARNLDGSYSWKFDPRVNHLGATDLDKTALARLWSQLEFPILLPWGRRSGVEDPDLNGFTDLFKDAQSVAFDAGHWPHHECQDDFIRSLEAFLQMATA